MNKLERWCGVVYDTLNVGSKLEGDIYKCDLILVKLRPSQTKSSVCVPVVRLAHAHRAAALQAVDMGCQRGGKMINSPFHTFGWIYLLQQAHNALS